MSTSTLATTLIVNNTQEISGISTTINNSDTEIPTAGAIYNFVGQLPKSLTVSGDWANQQYEGVPVDPTGLTFTLTYLNGESETIPVSSLNISPTTWENTGEQTATFTYYYVGGSLVFVWTANKTATVKILPIILNTFKVDTTATALNFT